MSVAHVAWAMHQQTGSPTRKAVLIVLSECANSHSGKCCPKIATIAERTEYSVPTVKRALSDLEDAGYFTRHRERRPDGTLGVYHYRLPELMIERADQDTSVIPDPGSPVIPQEPGTSLEPRTPPVVPLDDERAAGIMRSPSLTWAVDRKKVTLSEGTSATEALDEWNRQTGQSLKSNEWRAKIVMRQREHPDLTVTDHAHIIATALADPWWKGPPSPSVVYGNGALFERCMEAARGKPQIEKQPSRYGRGMTTRQMLDTIPGGTT